jgi:hypothetical protein
MTMRISALLLGATVLAGAASAQVRIEPFGEKAQAGEERRLDACSADRRRCAQLLREGESGPWRLKVGTRELPLPLGEPEGTDGPDLSLWPHVISAEDGSALIGVEHMRRQSYSGGGAGVTTLTLVEAPANGGALRIVAELPLQGSAMIRACFDERDARRRRGACHDEYQFEATLAPQADGRSARPDLLLTTQARTSPGRRSRFEENDRAIRRGEPAAWRDPTCSYRRLFTYDEATARYQPDRPLPACRDYLEP